mmetsp:Transcript_4227/g.13397  ORF Transcript_4227/g.13397 Transcript_4227/m.13397 type:complete len:321 (-) Transcript_4227:280-1242(-)
MRAASAVKMRTCPSEPPVTRSPFASVATHHTVHGCGTSATISPESTRHTRAQQSSQPTATWPPGSAVTLKLNAGVPSGPVGLVMTPSCSKLVLSHSRVVPSLETLANTLPSDPARHRQRTAPWCEVRLCTCLPSRHTRIWNPSMRFPACTPADPVTMAPEGRASTHTPFSCPGSVEVQAPLLVSPSRVQVFAVPSQLPDTSWSNLASQAREETGPSWPESEVMSEPSDAYQRIFLSWLPVAKPRSPGRASTALTQCSCSKSVRSSFHTFGPCSRRSLAKRSRLPETMRPWPRAATARTSPSCATTCAASSYAPISGFATA